MHRHAFRVVQKRNRIRFVVCARVDWIFLEAYKQNMSIVDTLKGGADRIATPCTVQELSTMLQLTVNAKTRYKGVDTPEGRQRLDRVTQLERNLTPILWSNPDPNELLDAKTKKDCADLLYELSLLSTMTVDWGMRAVGIRQRRKLEDLVPQVVHTPTTETA